jgi:hypothetical protein
MSSSHKSSKESSEKKEPIENQIFLGIYSKLGLLPRPTGRNISKIVKTGLYHNKFNEFIENRFANTILCKNNEIFHKLDISYYNKDNIQISLIGCNQKGCTNKYIKCTNKKCTKNYIDFSINFIKLKNFNPKYDVKKYVKIYNKLREDFYKLALKDPLFYKLALNNPYSTSSSPDPLQPTTRESDDTISYLHSIKHYYLDNTLVNFNPSKFTLNTVNIESTNTSSFEEYTDIYADIKLIKKNKLKLSEVYNKYKEKINDLQDKIDEYIYTIKFLQFLNTAIINCKNSLLYMQVSINVAEDTSGHSNMIIIQHGTLELYEPDFYNVDHPLNKAMKETYNPYGHGIALEVAEYLATLFHLNYIPPKNICPISGLQSLEGAFNDKQHTNKEPGGYCVAFSYLWVALRIAFNKIPPEKLHKDVYMIKPADLTKLIEDFTFTLLYHSKVLPNKDNDDHIPNKYDDNHIPKSTEKFIKHLKKSTKEANKKRLEKEKAFEPILQNLVDKFTNISLLDKQKRTRTSKSSSLSPSLKHTNKKLHSLIN